ncbi:MAG: DUF3737 family protein [Clostridia bacterium]|nr:DUF3737 family protein [Clostridia bacterium]
MEVIESKRFDSERALYESRGIHLIECIFKGAADGESALKESEYIIAEKCLFDLRYPFWHDKNVTISGCEMTRNCRAPIWYTENVSVNSSKLYGTKAVRECEKVKLAHCHIVSNEFGWDSCNFIISDTYAEGEYIFARSKDIFAQDFKMDGKYSFQYIENAKFDNCVFKTKDAFWHAKNVTVKNSVITGEYLGWYSENLTFENCIITGTQPLCYCKGLKLINCEMHGCDLAFEKSEVEAEITTPVISIKNVEKGKITVPCVDEIICDHPRYKGTIQIKNK